MRKELFFTLFSAILFFFCFPGKTGWPEPDAETKPWTWWWWRGNAVKAAMSFVDEDQMATLLNPGDSFVAPAQGKVYLAEGVRTGSKVHVPSPGGEGLAINTFDKGIPQWYVDAFIKSNINSIRV